MTDLQKQILKAVKIGLSRTGLPCHVHLRYLPEVLSLVNQGRLKLVKSTRTELIVDIAEAPE